MEQKTRMRRSLVILLLSLAVIVAAVLVTDRFSLRLDLSSDGANTLSKASRQLYKEIPEQVRLTYYISPKLSDRYPFPREIESLARSFAAASHGKIALDVIDPTAAKKENAIQALGIQPRQMQIVEKNEQRVALVYSGIVVQYLGRTHVLPFVSSTDTLEYDMVKAIKLIVSDKKSVASILIGDSGKSFQNDYKTLAAALQQSGWEARELSAGDEIPAETSVLFVLGDNALDDYDAYRIDAYLAGGGRALFAVEGVDVVTSQGLYAQSLQNDAVLRALESYGVKVDRDLVLDVSCNTAPFQMPSPFGGQAINYIRYPHWVMTRPEYRDSKNPLTARSSGLDLFWPSPLELESRSGVQSAALVKSTPKAWLQKSHFFLSPEEESQYNSEAGSTTGQYILAASLSGVLPSAYAGKPAPKREGAAALPALPQTPRPSRVLVVGSSDFASDFMTITDSSFNAGFLASAADWLSSGDDLVAIKTRGSRDSRLAKVQDPQSRLALISLAYIINLFLVPVLVIAFGIVRSVSRKRLAKDEAMLKASSGPKGDASGGGSGGSHSEAANGGDEGGK
jgi:ABC-type uncharacterized transport system involved in gliding motility auxiliary subunit